MDSIPWVGLRGLHLAGADVGGLRSWVVGVEEGCDGGVELALGGEDELDGVAARALSAGVGGDVVGLRALACGRALAVAMARPQARMTGRSTTSSPTKASSARVHPALATISRAAASLCDWPW